MAPVRLRGAIAGFLLLTAAYVGVLAWVDARNPVLAGVGGLLPLLPAMAAMSAASYLARYLRWRRLLARAGHPDGFLQGLLAYLAGFAFTATPGKVGELVRMRYLVPRGVPAPVVFGAFVFERALDLLVVLCLALLSIGDARLMVMSVVFVAIFVGGLVVVAGSPGVLEALRAGLQARGWARLARLAGGLRDALVGCRRWLNVADLSAGMLWGGPRLGPDRGVLRLAAARDGRGHADAGRLRRLSARDAGGRGLDAARRGRLHRARDRDPARAPRRGDRDGRPRRGGRAAVDTVVLDPVRPGLGRGARGARYAARRCRRAGWHGAGRHGPLESS